MQISFAIGQEAAKPEKLFLPDAEILFYPGFLETSEADSNFIQLVHETPWRHDSLKFAGKIVPVPRLQAWYGNKRSNYGYSGLALNPLPWTPLLTNLKEKVADCCQTEFNSVLLNYYRDGNDSVAWHSDDENELGEKPIIASLSLGTSRRFDLKHLNNKLPKSSCELSNGSLLVMGKGMQQFWKHQIPKQPGITTGRINLTFRKIVVSA
ncbi:MAG: alpha-ketoglutarate-dependent dioxygenase AlkB [Gammaproteobacteria bacterium]|nr:alpha-ketoglutarate-dependent dioxygenase AlkB [Gammaproteobacteria bacterium]